MKASQGRALGILLIVLGSLIAGFSEKIVFPGLEFLLGIETIVGKHNVEYLEGGGYAFTGVGAMIKWVSSVAAIGFATFVVGLWLWWVSRNRKTDS